MKQIKTETNTIVLEVRKVNQTILPLNLPAVTLCGKWLLDAGFNPGDNALAEVFEDAVLIRRVKKINKKDFRVIEQKIKA